MDFHNLSMRLLYALLILWLNDVLWIEWFYCKPSSICDLSTSCIFTYLGRKSFVAILFLCGTYLLLLACWSIYCEWLFLMPLKSFFKYKELLSLESWLNSSEEFLLSDPVFSTKGLYYFLIKNLSFPVKSNFRLTT